MSLSEHSRKRGHRATRKNRASPDGWTVTVQGKEARQHRPASQGRRHGAQLRSGIAGWVFMMGVHGLFGDQHGANAEQVLLQHRLRRERGLNPFGLRPVPLVVHQALADRRHGELEIPYPPHLAFLERVGVCWC